MKNEATNPGSRLAIARRQPGANLLPDDYVRGALTDAGYGVLPLGDRPLLYEALELVLKDDPESFTDLVDHLREILSLADGIDRLAELRRLSAKFHFIKACPDCGRKPDVDCSYTPDGQRTVVCFSHEGFAVGRWGPTIDEAIASWNRDDWIDPGITRPQFAFD
jgi:hypothetical protein